MKKEVHPGVVTAILVVVVALVVFVGYRLMTPTFKKDTSGSEKDIERVKSGEAFYKPPIDAGVAGKGGMMQPPGGGMMYAPPSGAGVSGGNFASPPPR